MSTEVKENWKGLAIGDDTRSTEAIRKFDVTFDNDNDAVENQALVLGLNGMPQGYEPHPNLPWLYVVGRTAAPKNGPKHWGVTITYNSRKNPLEVAPKVSYFSVESHEKIDRDRNGVPITNSAGETFDPPITKGVKDLVIRIMRNEPFFNEPLMSEYENAINADVFRTPRGDTFDPGTVKCNMISGDQVYPSDAPAEMNYYEVAYEFQIRWDGWKRRILDEGFRKKTTAGYETIEDVNGIPLSQPSMLDGSGALLADGADPVFKEFELDKILPFASLGIV